MNQFYHYALHLLQNRLAPCWRAGILSILLGLSTTAFSKTPGTATLTDRFIEQYNALECFNDENEKAGRKDLNRYILEVDLNDLDPSGVDDQAHLLATPMVKNAVTEFNKRTDMRLYVVVLRFHLAVPDEIDINTIPKATAHLNEYVQLNANAKIAYDNTLKHFRDVSNALMTDVANKLTKLGFKNRMIYLFRDAVLFDAEQRTRHFASDFLYIDGPLLKDKDYRLRTMAKLNWSAKETQTDPLRAQLEKAVYNLMAAVRLVIDEGIDNSADLAAIGCRISPGDAIEKTKELVKEHYAQDAKATASLIDHPTDAQRMELPKGSPYDPDHSTDSAPNIPFQHGGIVVDDLDKFPRSDMYFNYIMPDLVNMMASYSNVIMDVVFKEINFAMPPSDWAAFAETVYNQSAVAKQPKHLLLVVPYYTGNCTYTSMLGQKVGMNGMLLFPAVCFPENKGLQDEMNAAFAVGSTLTDIPGQPFEVAFKEAIKRIHKKIRLYTFTINWKGDLIVHPPIEKTDVGSDFFAKVFIRFDQRYKRYAVYDVGLSRQRIWPIPPDPSKPLLPSPFERAVTMLLKTPEDYVALPADGLVQSFLNPSTATEYAQWIAGKKTNGSFIGNRLNAPDDNMFYGGENTEEVEENIAILNALGMIPGPVGTLFNAVAVVYCLSKGHYEEAIMNAAFLAGTHVASLAGGSSLISKTGNGQFVLYPAEWLIATDFKEFSTFTNTIFTQDFLTRLSKYERKFPGLAQSIENKIIATLEQSETEAKAIVSKLNDNPAILDDYAKAATEKPIDLFDFMKNAPKLPGVDAAAVKGILASVGEDQIVVKSMDILQRLGAPPQDGWLHVIVHSSGNSEAPFLVFSNNTWTAVTGEELMARFSVEGLEGIQFFSCGCNPLKEIAEQLGAAYKIKIKIPNEPITILETGEAVAAKEGRWKIWDPKKGESGEWQVPYDDNTTPVPANERIRAATAADGDLAFLGTQPISYVQWQPSGDIWVFVTGADGAPLKVGSGHLNDNGFIGMTINVMIGENKTAVAKGGDVFTRIFEEIKTKHGTDNIKGIMGIWLDDEELIVNLKNFNDGIKEFMGQGMNMKDAAIKAAKERTFTGAMARKSGFPEVDNIVGYQYPDGHYPDAKVFFVRSANAPSKPIIFSDLRLVLGDAGDLVEFAAALPSKEGYYDLFAEIAEGKIIYRYKSGTTEKFDTYQISSLIKSKPGYKTGMPLRIVLQGEADALALNGPVQKLVNKLRVPAEIYRLPTSITLTPTVAMLGEDAATLLNSTRLRQIENHVDVFVHGSPDGHLLDVLPDGSIKGTVSVDAFVDWLVQQPAMQEAMRKGTPFNIRLFSCHAASTNTARDVSKALAKKGITGDLIAPDVAVAVWENGTITTNTTTEGGNMVRYSKGNLIGKEGEKIGYAP